MRAVAVSIGLALAGCANTGPELADDGLGVIELPAAAVAAEAKVVEFEQLDTGLQCERRVPTGTRIATRHCYTREESEQRAIAREIARRGMEELRDVQMYQELAHAEARRRALSEMSSRR